MRRFEVRNVRRSVRRSVSVRRWPLSRKIAIAAWIPVAITALALFTGPNRSTSAAPAAPTTTLPPQKKVVPTPATFPKPLVPGATAAEINAWVKSVPAKRTIPQRLAVLKFKATRTKEILADHKTVLRQHGAAIHSQVPKGGK